MSENLLKKEIAKTKKPENPEDRMINDAVIRLAKEANEIRSEQKWDNVLFTHKFIPFFKKWLFLSFSPFYRQTETTIFSLEKQNSNIILDCSYWLDAKTIAIDEHFYENLVKMFSSVAETDEFKESIEIFNDLAGKEYFDLTIFYETDMQYSRKNLFVRVPSEYFKSFIDCSNGTLKTKAMSVPCDGVVFFPHLTLQDYVGKDGEINGYRFRCTGIDGNNILLTFA